MDACPCAWQVPKDSFGVLLLGDGHDDVRMGLSAVRASGRKSACGLRGGKVDESMIIGEPIPITKATAQWSRLER